MIRNLLTAGALCIGIASAAHLNRPQVASAAVAAHEPEKFDVDYAPVEAFLKANCIDCHGADLQKGDLALDTYHDPASIIKGRKVWAEVIEKLRAGEMPPKKKKVRPDKAQQEVFLRTIDQIFYQHDQTHPLDPGQVTIRRLNRTEYNNTIRDLIGVNSQPAEDFPSDDVGQGFDNIGDVLSVSPILLERYLAAADALMQQAIPRELDKPLDHYVAGKYMEPSIDPSKLPDHQHRTISVGNSLFTHYNVHQDGQYTVKFRVYPDHPNDEGQPAEVEIQVDRKPVEQFTVQDGDKQHMMTLETKIDLHHGDHRFEVKVRRGAEFDSKWILRVDNAEFVGPPDTRPQSERMLLACDEKLSKHDQARQILGRFARRAYRRAVTDDEVNHLVEFAEKTQSQGQSWDNSISLAMEGALISPKFLFRVELDNRPDATGPHAIDEYQLASRLSYFLWSTMPDEELLELAGKNQLSANLESQVRRMLKDPRADALVDNFAIQWLQLRRLKGLSPDEKQFPEFSEQLRTDMLTETKMFISSVFREDRSILDLIDCDYTFLDQRLARFYQIGDTNGNPAYGAAKGARGERIPDDKFVRVHLADNSRGGVLTEAAVLAVTSNPTRTSPVKRGKFVLEQILGEPPPPPPPNVPQLPENKVTGVSLRQRMEQHRADPSCSNCHEHMDGMGFAFETYDAIGHYRTDEGGVKIDTSGTMPGGDSFGGAAELKKILKQRTDLFSRCLTKKMLIYATGRGVEYYDQRAVDKICTALKSNDYKFSTLVVEIVKSDPFLMRRGKEQQP